MDNAKGDSAFPKEWTLFGPVGLLTLLFLTAMTSAAPAIPEKPLALAKGGATEHVIVRPANPIPAEETAAKELASYLKKVTGAEFRIVAEDPAAKPAKAIYVGATAFAAAKGIDPAARAPEEWVVKTVGDDLVISGGRPRGTLYGVYEFLEEIVGVHLLDPVTEIVPSRAELTVNAPSLSGRPAFLYRCASSPGGPDRVTNNFWWYNKCDNLWWVGGDKPAFGQWDKDGAPYKCHTFGFYVHPDECGKEHPEYFAMHKDAGGTLFRNTDAQGTRNCWFDLCLTNPEVRKIVIGKLRGFIKTDREKAAKQDLPAPFIYSVDQGDCLPDYGCLCPDCRKIVGREGAESGLMLDFINAVADAIKDEYPDVLVQTFAYNHTLKAPNTVKPRDNVMIRWCDNYGTSEFTVPLTHERNRHMRDQFEPWTRISRHMAVWDYIRRFTPHTPGFYAPLGNISCLKPDVEYFRANGVESVLLQNDDWYGADGDLQSFHPLRVWLSLKLTQDPTRDERRLLDIFFAGYYGPAAGRMRELLAYLEKRQAEAGPKLCNALGRDEYYKAHLDLDFFLTARRILAEAEAAAADPLHRAHVARERIPVDSALLHLEPELRRAFCGEGRPWPFDRAQLIAEYADTWNRYIETCFSEKSWERVKALVAKHIDSLRSMRMIPRESFRCWAAPVADGAITIDGVLSEPAWETVGADSLTPLNKSQELKARTAVRTLWSKDMLYLAFECSDDRIGEMRFVPRKSDDPATWQDSSVEVFLNPSGDCKTYYQLVVNPAAAVLDIALQTLEGQRKADDSWSSGAKVAAKVNAESWVVEMAVPFKPMGFEPKPRAVIVANFCRSRYLKNDAEASQLTTWSPFLNVQFHEPDRFGRVEFASGTEELLASFEGPQDTPAIARTNNGCLAKVSQERDRASHGQASLRVEFPPTTQEKDLGVTLDCGELTDWSTFSRLMADIYLEGEAPVGGTLVRLVGNSNRSLSYATFNLKPGWNKDALLFDLLDPRAKLGQADLSNVRQIHTYTYWPEAKHPQPLVIFIDNIRLVRKQDGGGGK